jgi:Carboxypeptidase regulatory-like domain/Dockerin type I domain
VITQPFVLASANPLILNIGATGLVTVSLNNIPVQGYTSTEFTCTYNPSLVEVSNIVIAGLFGADPVSAINGPQGGSFILGIAGSNGNKAMGSGAAFTFNIKGLQAGQTVIECRARVSAGNNTLQSILFVSSNVSVTGLAPTSTPIPTSALLTGQVLASKPVTVRLYRQDNSIAATVTANPDGTFSITAPGGTYTVVASASGFLNAQGPITLVNGGSSTKPIISLPAGDIDNNGVINQLDAITIGINYNNTTPAAADLNNDGIINVLDLGLLAQNYLKSGALAW